MRARRSPPHRIGTAWAAESVGSRRGGGCAGERLAQANYTSREIKLDSVLKTAGPAPKEPAAADDEGDTDALDADTKAKLDVHLRETLRVVSDVLRLNLDPQYWADGRAPLTAKLHKG